MVDSNMSNNSVHTAGVQNHFIDTLVNLGFVDRKKLDGFESKSEAEIVKFIANGICTTEQIAQAFSTYYGLPFVRIKGRSVDPNVLKLISKEDAKTYQIIAYGLTDKNLEIGIGNPTILQGQPPAALTKLASEGYSTTLSIIPEDEIEWALNLYSSDSTLLLNSASNISQPSQSGMSVSQSGTQGSAPFVDLTKLTIPKEVLMKFPKEVAEKYNMVVFDTEPPINVTKASKKIKVALLGPEDSQAREILEFIKRRNNLEVEKYKCNQEGLTKSLSGYEPVIPSHPLEQQAKPELKKDAGDKEEEKKDEIGKKDEDNKPKINQDEPKVISEVQVHEENLSSDKKIGQMQEIASSVLKPEAARLKEGLATPYSPPPSSSSALSDNESDTKAEVVPEVKSEDIDTKAGLQSGADVDSGNMEENNLDKFLSRPVDKLEDLESVIKAGMIPEIVAAMVSLGIVMEISDIHIEATTENLRLRYRIDGILKDIIKMPLSLHAPLVSRIKILSKLKIDEQRVPQDGRFNVIARKHEIDLRVSTLPTVHGEKVVMRILDKSVGILTLEDMGITGVGFDVVAKNIKKPYGVILATGPTGSGKSTTLYAILQRISTTAVNVITLEDPVEYEISGINQTQVKPQIGFTFAEGLRAVLRQDPNIIMVGEIRDLETAAMATHAALTGHLVLSTLHTNDSAGALPRLINMGVEPFLITSSVNCIIAQRLVRKVCPKCKAKVELPEALIEDILKEISKISDTKIAAMKKNDLIFYHGSGCSECTNGYHGRIGIYEVLEMNEKIEELAVSKQPASAILEQACKDGMVTMKQDGILKALKGITTMDEVLRVTSSD
ncbi:MAG: ATPase, T2SS/T4P/T4SS family [bacterium]|nr:ATPase, T2SS/T4P/T4SS family [bacterium]